MASGQNTSTNLPTIVPESEFNYNSPIKNTTATNNFGAHNSDIWIHCGQVLSGFFDEQQDQENNNMANSGISLLMPIEVSKSPKEPDAKKARR